MQSSIFRITCKKNNTQLQCKVPYDIFVVTLLYFVMLFNEHIFKYRSLTIALIELVKNNI